MFPLQQISSDRMIHFSSINSNQPNRIPQDLILAHASMDGTSVRSSDDIKGKNRRRKLLATLDDKNFATPTTTTNQGNQKETHRDIERERRKQMTALYTLLRSLIPHEFIRVTQVQSISLSLTLFFFSVWINYITQFQFISDKFEFIKTVVLN